MDDNLPIIGASLVSSWDAESESLPDSPWRRCAVSSVPVLQFWLLLQKPLIQINVIKICSFLLNYKWNQHYVSVCEMPTMYCQLCISNQMPTESPNIVLCSLDHYSQETTLLHQIFGGYLRSQGKYHRFICIVISLFSLHPTPSPPIDSIWAMMFVWR